jgi:hypothetical protein
VFQYKHDWHALVENREAGFVSIETIQPNQRQKCQIESDLTTAKIPFADQVVGSLRPNCQISECVAVTMPPDRQQHPSLKPISLRVRFACDEQQRNVRSAATLLPTR